jgi:putative N6-adenine-specific DNA methylase
VRHQAFAQCAPGLEKIVTAELKGLGVKIGKRERGGIAFTATTRQLYAANLWLRCASRVIVRLSEFSAHNFAELVEGARALPWANYLAPGTVPRFRVTAHRSQLSHTGAIAERLADCVAEQVGIATTEDAHEQLFVVRNFDNRVTVSADASGDPLHKRGWRQAVAKAPLRETLAAALILASGWDRTEALVDPFCGAGTIPIEAALIARDMAPGRGRGFAFATWPTFEPGTWASVAGEARERERETAAMAPSIGTDRDDGAISSATDNAERAGVGDTVAFRRAPISDFEPPRPTGWVVTDPPHGHRLHTGDLRDLYATLGRVLRERATGWGCALLVSDTRLAGHAGLALDDVLSTTSGGRPVSILVSRTSGIEPPRQTH